MGKGIDAARSESPIHAQVLDDFKDQLLIAMVYKAGGKYSISVADVDATGGWVLEFAVRDNMFHFSTKRKA